MARDIFIFIGPPGAGKGSLSQLCIKNFGWIQVSTGNLCRQHIAQNTEIGKTIDFIIRSGKLIPDTIMIEMIERWLEEQISENSAIILDGFPRTISQAETFDRLLQKEQFRKFKVHVVGMDLSHEVAVTRILNRLICKNTECQAVYTLKDNKELLYCKECFMPLVQRSDDSNTQVIQERLLTYQRHKNALFEYYDKTGRPAHILNVEKPLDEVFGQFVTFIRASKSIQ